MDYFLLRSPDPFEMKPEPQSLVSRLKKGSVSYYETGTRLVSSN